MNSNYFPFGVDSIIYLNTSFNSSSLTFDKNTATTQAINFSEFILGLFLNNSLNENDQL